MLLKIFCIYDIKAACYLQPMFYKSTPEAIRAFSDACNDSSMVFFKHAEDYALFDMGTFDDSTGKFESLIAPYSVVSAREASSKHREFYAASSFDQSQTQLAAVN